MTTSTVLLLILSAIIAFAMSFYQYLFRAGKRSKTNLFLASLRFISLFVIFILLINPVIARKVFEIKKTPLPVLVDNSQSIKELGREEAATKALESILSDNGLADRYDVQPYTFDNQFESGRQPDFKGTQTNLDNAAQNLKQLYRSSTYPVILLTDGNQTVGNDYIYSFRENTKVYPLILGDTTVFPDLKVGQVNVNKFALLGNKFPVEVFLQYNGGKPLTASFSIMQGSKTLHKESVALSPSQKAKAVTVLLDASKVGVQTFRAVITSTVKEKNTYNNTKNFAVEVIDQRSEVALVSSINHPDLGALKRAIESNKQRHVSIVKPGEIKTISDYNVLILYQPDASFRALFEANKNAGLNTLIITGTNTDFNLLNPYQDVAQFRMTGQREDYSADYNSGFNLFSQENIGFENFPPLLNPFGTVTLKQGTSVLLQARIRNVRTDNPLLVFDEKGGKRNALLLGENIWKWRVESHLKSKSFEEFDLFADKIVQFLSSNSRRTPLVVSHESFYNSGELISIAAQFFNKNYEFDENARLTIQLKNQSTGLSKTYDFLKGNGDYKVNLDGLAAGKYSFSVKENTSKTTYNGKFEVLDFEIEKQFVNPDVPRLTQLAAATAGKVFFENQVSDLIKTLKADSFFKATEKATVKRTPLIDSVWLLILLCISLATEWFVRKYNGLL